MESPAFAAPRIRMRRGADGTVRIQSDAPLAPTPLLIDLFRKHAAAHPERILIADRLDGAWRKCMCARVDALAQGLIDRDLADRPIMILSGARVDHLALELAALTIGAPVVPVSVAYSLRSKTFDKLKVIADLVEPGVIFAQGAAFAPAVASLAAGRDHAVLASGGTIPRSMDLGALAAAPGAAVAQRHGQVRADTLAKILFTSGSTGNPKGVINTHAMLAINQQQMKEVWPFLATEPPVLLDWLPWSHTFGGNHNLNMVLAHGGSIWIDDGGPTPELVGRTVRNLADVQPTMFFNVPSGYAALIPILERDEQAAALFFKRLRLGFFAAAALPQTLWDHIEALARRHGSAMQMTTSWGLTETAPAATTTHFTITRSDNIGVPLPGVELKLVPVHERMELCIRGPNITPGYYRDAATTAEKFDAEGFFHTGDAVRLLDEHDAAQGMVFDGRIAENFKLSTGTFVNAGVLRPALLSEADGIFADLVVCGADTDEATALAWLSAAHASRCDPSGMPEPALRAEIAAILNDFATAHDSSSRHVERLLILVEPASLEAGELTDKGYINQARVRARRSESVAALRAESADPRVIWRDAARVPKTDRSAE